jgi:hypothetical protein
VKKSDRKSVQSTCVSVYGQGTLSYRFRNENVLRFRTKVSVHFVHKKIESSFNQFLDSRIQNMQISPLAQVDHSTVV